MDFEVRYDPQLEAFRRKVAAWLDGHSPQKPPKPLERSLSSQELEEWAVFQHQLMDMGWAAPSWPVEYGGGGLTSLHDVIVREELHSHDVPQPNEGNRQVATAILLWGNEEQRRRFLRPLLRGDTVAFRSVGYSDVVAYPEEVTTRAVRDGDVYIVSGAGAYTGSPGDPTHLWVVAVTNPDKQPHLRLGAFLIPLDLPGISTLDLETVGFSRQISVSLDEVTVPLEFRIGGEEDGWIVARSALDSDSEADRSLNRQRALVDALVQLYKGSPSEKRDQRIQELVAEAYINAKILGLLHLRNLWLKTTGQESVYQNPQYTLMAREMEKRLADTALEVMGQSALSDDPQWALDRGESELFQRTSLPGASSGDDTIFVQRLLWSYLSSTASADADGTDPASSPGEGHPTK